MKQIVTSSSVKMTDVVREELAKVQLPQTHQASFDPRIILGKLIVANTKIMDSKKKPIWLEFENGQQKSDDEEAETIKQVNVFTITFQHASKIELTSRIWNNISKIRK